MDLKSFCGTDPFRAYIHEPFSVGEFTYATNGHIMVRVPRLPDVPEQTKQAKWDAPFQDLSGTIFESLDHHALPKQAGPDCECTCENCRGSGKEIFLSKASTTVRGCVYNLRYIAMALALPGVEFAVAKKTHESPLLFRFDGGLGSVMPMRIEIEISKAA
jgi:hypothetical protein